MYPFIYFPVKLLQPVKGNKKVNYSQQLSFVSCYNFAMQASCIQEVMNRKEVLCVQMYLLLTANSS
jgi:hypothetical protein